MHDILLVLFEWVGHLHDILDPAEKEISLRQLHAEGKPVAAIARMVGLTKKTVFMAIGQELAVSAEPVEC